MTRFFESLGEFARFMPRVILAEKMADIEARSELAMLLKHEIKERLGKPERLPPPLASSTQDRREAAGYSRDETLLMTGKMRDSIGWEHASVRKTIVGSTDEKAVWHELGPTNGHFPARSFIASTVAEKEAEAFELYVKTFGVSFKPR